MINQLNCGWRVYHLSLAVIHEIFYIKEAIEGMVAWRAAASQDEALKDELRQALLEMTDATQHDDIEAWLRTDMHLHHVLFSMANNECARRVVDNLNDQWHRV